MSAQIAIRLPEQMVAFLDKAVSEGKAASRAALVGVALEREMRRQAAQHDAEILSQQGPGDELDALVTWTTRNIDVAD